jgi:hypothetical protein
MRVLQASMSVQAYHAAVLDAALNGDRQAQVRIADLAHRLDRLEEAIWESLEWCSAQGRAAYIRHDRATVSVRRVGLAGRHRDG